MYMTVRRAWRGLRARIAERMPKKRSLERQLTESGRTRWVDIGSVRFDPGFICVSLHDPEQIPKGRQKYLPRYRQIDILGASDAELDALGQFDLVRLQHVFEHFSPEEGLRLLGRLRRIMAPDGYLVMSVPDLRCFIELYHTGFHKYPWWKAFAERRVPKGAPRSFYFSLFAHQFGYQEGALPGTAHRWCYDAEGLIYQVERAGGFRDARILSALSPLASIPFTHNRVREDLCLIARKA